jgi:outer membrane protein TolC
MQENDRLKKWRRAAVLTCMLTFMIASLHLFAQEPAQADHYKPVQAKAEMSENSGEVRIIAGEILTLNRCIDIALWKNPAIVAAVNTVEVNRSRVNEARSNYYPQISATASYERVLALPGTPTAAFEGTSPFNELAGVVTLNQTILDFGRTSSAVDISKRNLESSRLDLETTEDLTILSVKQAYYGVL